MKLNITLFNFHSDEHKTIKAIKCHKPKMSDAKGATWDVTGETESGIGILCDTSWGLYGYFQQDNQWYKFRMID